MSCFLFQRKQFNCFCFDNSPKHIRRIFRTDKQQISKSDSKEDKLTYTQKNCEQAKHKKKSLKKQRQYSKVRSQKDPKQKDGTNLPIFIPQFQYGFNSNQVKKEPKLTVLQFFQQPLVMQIKHERVRQIHNLRTQQRSQHFYDQIIFQVKPPNHLKTNCKFEDYKKVIKDLEYDKLITQEFQKDFKEFSLKMEIKDKKSLIGSVKQEKTKKIGLLDKFSAEKIQKIHHVESFTQSASKNMIPILQNKKLQQPIVSLGNSQASNTQKTEVAKIIQKMLPKQIQSQKGSNSDCQSDKQSVLLGRGLDGLTEKNWSLEQVQKEVKNEILNLETTVTQSSQIRNSQVQSLTEHSNIMASPKSLIGKGMAFGGLSRYGATGMSFQQKGDSKQSKLHTLSKLNF